MLKGKITVIFTMLTIFLCSAINAAQPENTEKYNVFAVVSTNIARIATRAANDVYKEEGLNSFPGKGYQIHSTLYMTIYPKEALTAIDEKVKKIAQNVRQFKVNTTGLEITEGDWLFIGLENNAHFQALADVATKMLSPLRYKSNYVPEWAKNMPGKIKKIKEYGSPNVFDEFNPHLTITAKEDAAKLNHFISIHGDSSYAKPIEGQIIAIGYGIADKNGQVAKPIKIYDLRKK